MKNITIPAILKRLQEYLNQDCDYDTFRNFIYARYEGEEEMSIEDDADDVLSVLSPYIETEEAVPDNKRDMRLQRVCKLLRDRRGLSPTAITVFALKYDEIAQLVSKKDNGVITTTVFCEQVRKLTPAEFDLDSIVVWAEKQKGDSEPDIEKIA